MIKEEEKELASWKRYCSGCGEELNIEPVWRFSEDTGVRYIRIARYCCPNKRYFFDSHDKYKYDPNPTASDMYH